MLESSTNPSSFGASITFTAKVSSEAARLSGRVELFDGKKSLGQKKLSDKALSFEITTLSEGEHPITARYLGNASRRPHPAR